MIFLFVYAESIKMIYFEVLMSSVQKDAELIDKHGGATALAQTLGYNVQRVQNWKIRGIPAKERLKHPELLLVDFIPTPKK
ncbi:hypothetical protein WFS14_000115 [Acinetobacter baumannii]|nr:hypothetical protein [Acinetobacter baumannii]EKU5819833.1 hypothetical protein [Acinetobacter baumannii]EKV9934681.1 hypothetical protein [Acinetobacter baumannii]EKV9938213.1 hypothetical protein [Acinetobacter baumannii]ELA8956722.1 hypothetical protein [Acinetobacter baumannii]